MSGLGMFHLHGLTTVAELKRLGDEAREYPETLESPRPHNRGRIEAARICGTRGGATASDPHGLTTVAELKRGSGWAWSLRGQRSPRPHNRGRIEAARWASDIGDDALSPRPHNRGRIEASLPRRALATPPRISTASQPWPN